MDLFCEITVVNHSELSLHVVTQTNTHGSWDFHGTDLIHPTQFGRFTAKDPAGAAFGSEGWVRFADETGCTFSLAYCCSYKKGGNYCFLVEASPLLDVTLRFGNEVPPVAGDKFWGSDTFKRAGNPLGILVYVEQRSAKSSLSVLTYNAHLFEGAKSVAAEQIHRDRDRADELLRRIHLVDPDVICLEGAWALADQALATTFEAYPYVFPSLSREFEAPDSWLSSLFIALQAVPLVGPILSIGAVLPYIAAPWGKIRDALASTNGLLLLSRFPLQHGRFTEYKDLVGGNDPLNRKGLLEATAMFPAGTRTPTYLRIGATHGPSDLGEAQRVVLDVAAPQALADTNQDRLLLGDFNLPASNAHERQTLDAALGGRGASDLVGRFLPNLDKAYTEWPAENGLRWALHQNLKLEAPSQGKDRRDYVYFAPRQRASFLEPTGVSIPRDWSIDCQFSAFDKTFETLPLSDHDPVITRFGVAVPRIAPYPRFLDHRETAIPLADVESGKYTLALPHGTRTVPDTDLYCLRRTGSPSGRIDLRVLEAASGWTRLKLEIPTRLLPSEEASYPALLLGDYHARNVQDLFALKRGGTRLEVHVLDAKPPKGNAYWDYLIEWGTPIDAAEVPDFDFFLGHYNSEGRPDLFAVKHRNTSRGKVEIHILTGKSQYQKFALQIETSLPVDPSGRLRFGVARFDRVGGNSDVFALMPGPRVLEVQVFDGTRGFQSLAASFATALPAADAPNFDFRIGDCAQTALSGPLYALKRRNTSRGKLEVHLLGREP